MCEWISVSNDSPNEGELVLLKTQTGQYDLGTLVTIPWHDSEWSFYHGQNLGYPLDVIAFKRLE